MSQDRFESLRFGALLVLMARVWARTLAAQAILWCVYIGLLALSVAGLWYHDAGALRSLAGLLSLCLFVFILPGIPYMMAGMMAPAAVGLICDEAPGAPWRRGLYVLCAATLYGWIVLVLSNLMLIPGLLALFVLWPWAMVVACEPGASVFKRAQQVSGGVWVKVIVWYLAVSLIQLAPLLIASALFIHGYSTMLGKPGGGDIQLLSVILFALSAFVAISLKGAFWATLYALRIRDERTSVVGASQ